VNAAPSTSAANTLRAVKLKSTELRAHLRNLTAVVTRAIADIDAEMRTPSTADRGKRIAQICNRMQLANDMAKRFGLSRRRPAKPRGSR